MTDKLKYNIFLGELTDADEQHISADGIAHITRGATYTSEWAWPQGMARHSHGPDAIDHPALPHFLEGLAALTIQYGIEITWNDWGLSFVQHDPLYSTHSSKEYTWDDTLKEYVAP